MKQKLACVFIVSLICVHAGAQIKTNTVKNPSLLKTTTTNSQSSPQNKTNSSTQNNNAVVNMNTLTAANPKMDGLAEFTYKGGEYDEVSKKLFIHGCANVTGIPCMSGPCTCSSGATIKILNTTNTKFRVDAIVSYDKSYYNDVPLVDVSKIPDGNNYYFSASGPGTYYNAVFGKNVKVLITDNNLTAVPGVKKLTLTITKKADGTSFTSADFKDIEVFLTSDFAFELRSVTVTPL